MTVSPQRQAEIDAENLDKIRMSFLQNLSDAGHLLGTTQSKTYIARHEDPPDTVSLGIKQNPEQGIKQLQQEQRVLNARTGIQHDFHARREEGAIAISRVMHNYFRVSGQDVQATWFGDVVPPQEDIPIGVVYDEVTKKTRTVYESAPMYSFSLPLLDTEIELTTWEDDEQADMLRVRIETKVEYQAEMEVFFRLIEEELRLNSIYKGKLLSYRPLPDGSYKLEFIHYKINPHITYNQEVERDLFNHMWGKIKNRSMLLAGGRQVSFRCLVYGELGCGKTETCKTTVVKAVDAGYTAIVYSPQGQVSVRDISRCFKLAGRYGPSVIYIEDWEKFSSDTISSADRSTLTNLLDGADKNSDISVVLTTNFVKRIDPALTRGQRMTGVIKIGALDTDATERMLRSTLAGQLDPDTDFAAVWEASKGFSPAYLMNSFEHAQTISSMHEERHDALIGTEGLVGAAQSMRGMRDLNQEQVEAREAKKPGFAELATESIFGWVRQFGHKIRFTGSGFSVKE